MIPDTVPALRWSLALVLVAYICFRRGGPPERVAITGVLVADMITSLAVAPPGWIGPLWTVIAADGVAMIISMVVLVRSRRFWPMYCCAFQGISLAFYCWPLIERGLPALAYHLGSILFDYLTLATLALGTLIEGPKPLRFIHARGDIRPAPGA